MRPRSHPFCFPVLTALVALPATVASAAVVDRVVAVVNDDILLESQIEDRIGQFMGEVRSQPTQADQERKLREIRSDILDHLIDDQLIEQQAQETKVTVDEKDLEKVLADIEQRNHITHDQLVEALGAQGYAYKAYKEDIRHQLLMRELVNTVVRDRISVSDEEVHRYYDQNVAASGEDRQVHLRHILVAVPPGASADVLAQRRAVAAKVVDDLHAKPDSFADEARAYSDDDSTKGKGGDLGWISPGMLEDELDQAVFAKDQVGALLGPIPTGRGFEVVQLLDIKKTRAKSFDDVKDEIRQKLYEQAVDRQTKIWLGELRKKASIDIRL